MDTPNRRRCDADDIAPSALPLQTQSVHRIRMLKYEPPAAKLSPITEISKYLDAAHVGGGSRADDTPKRSRWQSEETTGECYT